MIPGLTLFPFISRMRNRTLRRIVMVVVCPLVLIETYINATIGFVNGFQIWWNAELPKDEKTQEGPGAQ